MILENFKKKIISSGVSMREKNWSHVFARDKKEKPVMNKCDFSF
jgi:hypothetical protein